MSNLLQDALDAVQNNSELKAILSKDGIIVEEFSSDRQETVKDYMSICGYSEEDAVNAFDNLETYE